MTQDSNPMGHVALCEELLGLMSLQRKALIEGQTDVAERLMEARADVLERIKPLVDVPPSPQQRERVRELGQKILRQDAELQTILRMQISSLGSHMGTVGKTRTYAESLSSGISKSVPRLNIKS